MKIRSKKRIAAACAVAALSALCLLMAFGALDMGPMSKAFGADLEPENVVSAEEVTGDVLDISEVKVGDVRVQLLSDTVLRVEERSNGTFENRPSYLVPDRGGWEKMQIEVKSKEGETQIYVKAADSPSTAYVVHVPEQDAQVEDVYVTDESGKLLWNFTGMTSTNMYLPSPSDELRSWYFTESPRVIPSEYGYSGESDEPLQGWEFDKSAVDAYVFLPGGSYEQFTSDYVKVTGRSEMVSLQMLGFWDSRYYAYTADTALQQIKDYTDRGYAIDVLVIDTDWRNGTSGSGYEINTELFPNMAQFLEDCHELGVNVCFNDHPDPLADTENSLDKEEVQFRKEHLTLLLSLGLDYWWYDRNWTTALKPIDDELSVYAFGMYAYNWVTDEYLQSIKDLNGYAERALMMSNIDGCQHGVWTYASDITAHRYSIQWTGDIHADEDDLAQEIYASVFGSAEVGIPYISSDLGGHNQSVTSELYGRWFQYGALSAICRVHCMKNMSGQPGRMPWIFGSTAEEIAHTYQDMRYRLLPLYYDLVRKNYDTGLPIVRRLDIVYPQYAEAARNDEYLLGDYILIAPIATAEKDASGTVSDTRTVFLPEGTWIDVWSGKRYSGPATVTVTHPIETSPVFVREGALVVLAENMSNTSEKFWDDLTLDIYPSVNFDAETRLYEDDVTTDAYQYGEYRTTDISMAYEDGKFVVTIGKAEGNFRGVRAFEERSWNIRLHKNEGWGDLVYVKVNGKTVSLAKYFRDEKAKPFAFSGAAADGDLYEFTISGPIDREYKIEFAFENMTPSAVAEGYDATETPFTMEVGGAGKFLDMTQAAIADYLSVGDNGDVNDVRRGDRDVFSVPTSYDDGVGTIYEEIWTESSLNFGKKFSEYETSYSSIASQKDFALTIHPAETDARYFILYLGGTQCTAKVTVRDRSGNYVRTESFGDRDGTFLERVIIDCKEAGARGTLYVTYSMLSTEQVGFEEGMSSQVHAPSPSNVYFLAAVAATEKIETVNEEQRVEVTAGIESTQDAPLSANLTSIGSDLFFDEETLDWMHFSGAGDDPDEKNGGTAIANVAFSPAGAGFSDFTTGFTYVDAEDGRNQNGTHNGSQTRGTISVNVRVDENTSHIVIYTGAWKNINQLTVWSQGQMLCEAGAFSGGDVAATKCVVIRVDAAETTSVMIRIEAQDSSAGNVSLAAVAVTGGQP